MRHLRQPVTSLVATLLLFIVSLAGFHHSAHAQAITITANTDTMTVPASSSGLTTTFRVLNDSSTSVVVRLTCLFSGSVTACSGVPTSVTVASRHSTFVMVFSP